MLALQHVGTRTQKQCTQVARYFPVEGGLGGILERVVEAFRCFTMENKHWIEPLNEQQTSYCQQKPEVGERALTPEGANTGLGATL